MSPRTTEGTAAMNSVSDLMISLRRPSANSEMKTAAAMPSGIANRIAIPVTQSDPVTAGRNPNLGFSEVGNQSMPESMERKLTDLNARREFSTRNVKMAASTMIATHPEMAMRTAATPLCGRSCHARSRGRYLASGTKPCSETTA